jgi:DNA-binding CsgD family transcriptional regulator
MDIHELGRELARARTREGLVDVALSMAPGVLDAPIVGIVLLGARGSEVRKIRGTSDRVYLRYEDFRTVDAVLARAAQSAGPVHERMVYSPDDWHRTSLYADYGAPHGFESYMVAPILGEGVIRGFMQLTRRPHEARFSPTDVARCASVACYLSISLARVDVVSGLDGVSDDDWKELTSRESQIASLVRKGLTNREIGKVLSISENTVKKALKSVFAKWGTSTRAELAGRFGTSTPR